MGAAGSSCCSLPMNVDFCSELHCADFFPFALGYHFSLHAPSTPPHRSKQVPRVPQLSCSIRQSLNVAAPSMGLGLQSAGNSHSVSHFWGPGMPEFALLAWSPLANARWGTHGQRKTLCQQQCHGRCLRLASNCSLPLLASLSGEPAVAAAQVACSKGRSKHCSAQGLAGVKWGCPSSDGTACPAPFLCTPSGVAAESVCLSSSLCGLGGIKRDCGGGKCCLTGNQQEQGTVASSSLGRGEVGT